jgi:hypothetical protein
MTPEHWKQMKELLDEALQLDPNERPAFLDRVGAKSQENREQLKELIACAEESWDFVEQLDANEQPVWNERSSQGGLGPCFETTGLQKLMS